MKTMLAALATLVTAVACTDAFSPPSGLQFSAASWTCSRETAIYLTSQPMSTDAPQVYPFVYILVPRSPTELQTFIRLPSASGATAHYLTGPNQSAYADSGRVRLERVTKQRVLGSVSLYFPSGPVTGDFDAPWMNQGVICAFDAHP